MLEYFFHLKAAILRSKPQLSLKFFLLANVQQIYIDTTSSLEATMPYEVTGAGGKTTTQVAGSHIHIYLYPALVQKSLRLVIEQYLRISKLKKRLE